MKSAYTTSAHGASHTLRRAPRSLPSSRYMSSQITHDLLVSRCLTGEWLITPPPWEYCQLCFLDHGQLMNGYNVSVVKILICLFQKRHKFCDSCHPKAPNPAGLPHYCHGAQWLADYLLCWANWKRARQTQRHDGGGELGCNVAMVCARYDGWHSVLPRAPVVTTGRANTQWLVGVWLLSVWLGNSVSKYPWGRKWNVTTPSHSIASTQSASSCQRHLVHLSFSLPRILLSHSVSPFLAIDPFFQASVFHMQSCLTGWSFIK